MNKPKLFIVSAFSGPLDGVKNNRFVYLADYVSDKFEVELLTTNFYHSKKEIIKEIYDFKNFTTKVFHVPRYKSNISFARLWSHFIFALRVFKYLRTYSQTKDIIYCSFPPVTVSIMAFAAAKDKKKLFLDVQDLWPEVFYSSKKMKFLKPFFFIHRLCVKLLAKRLINLISVSETYLEHFKSKGFNGANEAVVYIGVDIDLIPDESVKRRDLNAPSETSKTIFVYAGTLGYSYNLETVIKCFSEAEKKKHYKKRIELVILGSGPLENDLRSLSKSLDTNVEFTGRVSYPEVIEYLRNADVAVNSIAAGMQQSIINKHGDYTIMGLPILNTQDNYEFVTLVDNFGIGLNTDPNSQNEIVEAIVKLGGDSQLRDQMAQNSIRLGQERFNRANSYGKIKKLLLDAI